MKKTSPRKLQLSSETLRRLSDDQLPLVAGAMPTASTASEVSTPETTCVACGSGASPAPKGK